MPIYRIDLEPVAKGRPRFSARKKKNGEVFGHAYMPERTRTYEKSVREILKKSRPTVIEGPVSLRLEFVLKRPGYMDKPKFRRENPVTPAHTNKPDSDNLEKAVKDACNGLLWLDDSQVVHTIKSKRYAEPGEEPHTILEVSHASSEIRLSSTVGMRATVLARYRAWFKYFASLGDDL